MPIESKNTDISRFYTSHAVVPAKTETKSSDAAKTAAQPENQKSTIAPKGESFEKVGIDAAVAKVATQSNLTATDAKIDDAKKGDGITLSKVIFFVPGLLYLGGKKLVDVTFNTVLPWAFDRAGEVMDGVWKYALVPIGEAIEHVYKNYLKKPIDHIIEHYIEPMIENYIAPAAEFLWDNAVVPTWEHAIEPTLEVIGKGLKFVFYTAPNAIAKFLDPVWKLVAPVLGPVFGAIRDAAFAIGSGIGDAVKSITQWIGQR